MDVPPAVAVVSRGRRRLCFEPAEHLEGHLFAVVRFAVHLPRRPPLPPYPPKGRVDRRDLGSQRVERGRFLVAALPLLAAAVGPLALVLVAPRRRPRVAHDVHGTLPGQRRVPLPAVQGLRPPRRVGTFL